MQMQPLQLRLELRLQGEQLCVRAVLPVRSRVQVRQRLRVREVTR